MTDNTKWVKLSDVPAIIQDETGATVSRQTVYNWAKAGKLRIAQHRPLRTTTNWVRDCIVQHLRVRR